MCWFMWMVQVIRRSVRPVRRGKRSANGTATKSLDWWRWLESGKRKYSPAAGRRPNRMSQARCDRRRREPDEASLEVAYHPEPFLPPPAQPRFAHSGDGNFKARLIRLATASVTP